MSPFVYAMRLSAHIRDQAYTCLFDDRVPMIHRRDRERHFFLRTGDVYTPLGVPLSFVIDIGPKGQGLTVYSIEAVMLSVFGFDLWHTVRLRLPSDEVVEIELRNEPGDRDAEKQKG